MARILLPVDFSTASENASKFVAALSRDLPLRIKMFHAHFDPVMDSDLPTFGFSEGEVQPLEKLMSKAEADMAALVDETRLLMTTGAVLDSEVVYGSPQKEILEAARQMDAEFIAMGTRGKGKIMKTFLGSVAAKVAEKATVPVWVIPSEAKYQGIQKVLYASDFDDFDGQAINDLIELLKPLEVEVHCVHLFDDVDKQILGDDEARLEKELRQHIGEHCRYPKLKFAILNGQDILEALDEYVQKEQIELLTMTTHHRNFITRLLEPSLMKRILSHTHLPLLSFHTHYPKFSQMTSGT